MNNREKESLAILRRNPLIQQNEIADMLQCTQQAYSTYERGERDIPSKVLIKLADYYNTSVDYLLGRTNNPAPPAP